MRVLEVGGPVTPRQMVRRAQARAVLQHLERRGGAVTAQVIEYQAIALYAGQIPHPLIWEIVLAACELRGLTPPERKGRLRDDHDTFAYRAEPPPGAHSSDDVHDFVHGMLRINPSATSTELLDRLEAEAPIPMARSSFVALVRRARRTLDIEGPNGRPSRNGGVL